MGRGGGPFDELEIRGSRSGGASPSGPSSTPGRCVISSDEAGSGDFAKRLSVDVLPVRSDAAREGAADAIGDKMGSREGMLLLLLPFNPSDDRREEPVDRMGRSSGVYAGEGPRSAIERASSPGGGPIGGDSAV